MSATVLTTKIEMQFRIWFRIGAKKQTLKGKKKLLNLHDLNLKALENKTELALDQKIKLNDRLVRSIVSNRTEEFPFLFRQKREIFFFGQVKPDDDRRPSGVKYCKLNPEWVTVPCR